MKLITAYYLLIQTIYINSGFNEEVTACYLRNNMGYKLLVFLRFMGKFLKDFDLKDEIYDCLDKAIIYYHHTDIIKERN